MENITLDELLAALEAANAGEQGQGYTVAELSVAMDMNIERVRSLLKKAIAAKRVRPARKIITDMAGRPAPVPSYVLVEA